MRNKPSQKTTKSKAATQQAKAAKNEPKPNSNDLFK